MRIYIENVNIYSVVTLFVKIFLKNRFQKVEKRIFYIYKNKTSFLFIFFLKIFKIKLEELKFTMMEIRDKKNEIIRLKIPQIDLYLFEKKILKSKSYKFLVNNSKVKEIEQYIFKNIVAENYTFNKNSIFRTLYLINVISWKNNIQQINDSIFLINNRPWEDIYKEYALNFNINLITNIIDFQFVTNLINKIIRIFKDIILIIINTSIQKKLTNNNIKLFCEGRGNINLIDNGYHSDFFWLFNSNFLANKVLCNCLNNNDKKILEEVGINNTFQYKSKTLYNFYYKFKNLSNIKLNKTNLFKYEKKIILKQVNEYKNIFSYWINYFKLHNVKIFLTWDKYDGKHIAMADAIEKLGGISSIWQMAFDGMPFYECNSKSDIIFNHSLFSTEIERLLSSNFKYSVITGFPVDYSRKIIQEKANLLRKKLQNNGAKKIICVFDENSHNDLRWHTGDLLQRDNYKYILEELLNNQDIGVIFKPKTAATLRERLGDVNNLLIEAEKTKRCFVYESKTYSKLTKASPLLAGLSSDLVIHSHLSAGTAAIECALQGIPTLLIDREGAHRSIFNDLPKEKIIFKDWPSIILAI